MGWIRVSLHKNQFYLEIHTAETTQRISLQSIRPFTGINFKQTAHLGENEVSFRWSRVKQLLTGWMDIYPLKLYYEFFCSFISSHITVAISRTFHTFYVILLNQSFDTFLDKKEIKKISNFASMRLSSIRVINYVFHLAWYSPNFFKPAMSSHALLFKKFFFSSFFF